MTTETWTEDEHGLIAEAQGSYAPEMLNPEGGDDVFSRRWTSETRMIDVYAAPTIPASYTDILEPYVGDYAVTVITEVRQAGDEGGDTSEYEYEEVTDALLPYDTAVAHARQYIESLDPDYAF